MWMRDGHLQSETYDGGRAPPSYAPSVGSMLAAPTDAGVSGPYRGSAITRFSRALAKRAREGV